MLGAQYGVVGREGEGRGKRGRERGGRNRVLWLWSWEGTRKHTLTRAFTSFSRVFCNHSRGSFPFVFITFRSFCYSFTMIDPSVPTATLNGIPLHSTFTHASPLSLPFTFLRISRSAAQLCVYPNAAITTTPP